MLRIGKQNGGNDLGGCSDGGGDGRETGRSVFGEEVVVEQTNIDEGNAETLVEDKETLDEVMVEDKDKEAGVDEVMVEDKDKEACVDEVMAKDKESLDEGVNEEHHQNEEHQNEEEVVYDENTLDDFEFFDPFFGDQYEEQHQNEQNEEVEKGHQVEEENVELVDEENNVPEMEVDMTDFQDILQTIDDGIGTEWNTDFMVVEGEVESW
ncbi:hypothetical protein L2E82_23110 [Cichorium intybus]|uniref:Uncharacterized protein n=1 Tax=Cichorium intybus TaxID=13427 RepID=A0ACB9DZT9_CICIN|nr:hypothetical protein L2E82_23110 [Cichorium intybus]